MTVHSIIMGYLKHNHIYLAVTSDTLIYFNKQGKTTRNDFSNAPVTFIMLAIYSELAHKALMFII